MSVLISSDWHLSDKLRDSYRLELIPKLHSLIKERKIHSLIIAGDITEEKEYFPAEFVNKIVDIFYGLSQLCMVTITTGNHDFIGNPQNPFFEFLRHIRNIDWIKVPTIKPFGIFLPWTGNWQRDWNGGKTLRGHKRIICHQTFKGSVTESGKIMEDGIPIDILPQDAIIYSGDIHKPQKINNVIYVGAPYLVDYGDDYNPRVLLLEDNGKRISIPIKGRQKRLIEIPQSYKGSLTDNFAYTQYIGKGDIVKFRVNLDDASKFNEFKQRIYEWGAKSGVTIDGIQGIKTVELTKEKKLAKTSVFKRPDKELVHDHAKREQLDEKTLNTGLEFVE